MKELAKIVRLLARTAARRPRLGFVLGAALLVIAVESSVVLAGASPFHGTKAGSSSTGKGLMALAATHGPPGSRVIVGH